MFILAPISGGGFPSAAMGGGVGGGAFSSQHTSYVNGECYQHSAHSEIRGNRQFSTTR